MPHKPPRPCRSAGCPATTSHRSGWCQEHRPKQMWRKRIRATTTQRGYGHAWRKKRAALLAARPLCKLCDDNDRVTLATEVDHILPKSQGGSDAWDNLQPICSECHKAKTAKEKLK